MSEYVSFKLTFIHPCPVFINSFAEAPNPRKLSIVLSDLCLEIGKGLQTPGGIAQGL
jgi:hypothetical protein